jgi:hypothetical protein
MTSKQEWISLRSLNLPNYEISNDARIRNKKTQYTLLNVLDRNKIIAYIRNNPRSRTPILLDIKATYMRIFSKFPNFRIKCRHHNIKNKNKNKKKVEQLSLDGTHIRTFRSASEASRKLHLSRSCISLTCNGKRKNAAGYKWRFVSKN